MEHEAPEAAKQAAEVLKGLKPDPILAFPSKADTHDDFRRLRNRGFFLHKSSQGPRKSREGETRGKAAKKALKREMRALREIHEDIRINGID